MSSSNEYDYIFAGAGCAGLSLAVHMMQSPALRTKKILLIDKDPKRSNDRTWCFWENAPSIFEPVVYHSWPVLELKHPEKNLELDIAPYWYKMIRGIDFYDFCRSQLSQLPNVSFITENILSVQHAPNGVSVQTDKRSYEADYCFSSLPAQAPPAKKGLHWLLQHFRGWVIETQSPFFDPRKAILMDFRMEQSAGTSFCYVLPFSDTRALVEYTVFSQEVFDTKTYDEELARYLEKTLGCGPYSLIDTEQGQIPMTNYKFPEGTGHIINLGTAGGQTKGSSGYTFRFIQKHSAAIVAAFESTGMPSVPKPRSRFDFYDSVLLEILATRKLEGSDIFLRMFEKNNPADVLKFLDNETTLAEELNIISSLPTLPFARAAMKQF